MVRLQLLGPPEVLQGRQPVPLPPKLLALMGYLALSPGGRFVGRETLMDIFWPSGASGSARNALNQAVHEIRKRLGWEVLESRGKGEIALGKSVYSDVREFHTWQVEGNLAGALGLYRGDLLAALHIAGAPAFEQWLEQSRYRLRRNACEVATTLATLDQQRGRIPAAVSWLRRAIELDPTDERLARRLMCLLLDAGDRAGARREYDRLVRDLRIHLDLEPSAESRSVGQSIATRVADGKLRGGAAEVVTLPTAERRIAWNLVERAQELAYGDRVANAAARELLVQAVGVDPELPPARTARARALAHWVQVLGGPRRAAREAVSEAEVAVALDRASVEAQLAKGCGLEALTRFRGATEAFRNAIRLRPQLPEAVSRFGRALMYAGDAGNSRTLAADAARRQGEDADLLLQLGMSNFVLDRHDEGREATAAALRLRPGDQYAEAAWAFYELAHGKFDGADAALSRLLDRESDNFMGHFFRGDLAMVQRDFERAFASYQRCYDIDPAGRAAGLHLSSQAVLGFLHIKAGDPGLGRVMLDAAEADVEEALLAGAEFGGFYFELAIIAAGRGQTTRAVARLKSAYRRGFLQYHFIDRHPAFDELRPRADYRDLLAAMQRSVARQGRRCSASGAAG